MTQTFRAKQDTPLLYTFKYGGGINGRKVKAGELVTVVSESIEIDTPCVRCLEILHKTAKAYFLTAFEPA